MKKLGETIGKFVVKHRILIVIASILLCIPSLFGYINTDINYDILAIKTFGRFTIALAIATLCC